MRKSPSLSRSLAALALLPAFLGGGVERWSQGVSLLFLGLLLIVAPPRHSLGRAINLVMGLLVCGTAAAFLPAGWFPLPAWRLEALRLCTLDLGSRVSPQPWLTAESLILFGGALAWLYYLVALHHRIDRRIAFRWLCAGTILWAALAIDLNFAGLKWPGQTSLSAVFGAFPNRNHTANFLAVGAILSLAYTRDGFRRGKKSWPLWACGWLILLWGLLLANSRAGLVLSFLGIVIWGGSIAILRLSERRLGAGAGFLLVLLGGFLLGGGTALERFTPEQPEPASLRWSIQSDALDLTRSAPWTGVGLGNFESVFSIAPHRALGLANYRVLHPESDWIWLAAEAGWPCVALTLCGCALFARRIFPLGRDPDWRLRAAAGTAAFIFMLHGLVDVPGHRLGSIFPALFVLALALRSPPDAGTPRWIPVWFRAVGCLLTLAGVIYLAGSIFPLHLPGTAAVLRADRDAAFANSRACYGEASSLSTSAIRWAPMQWRLYYHRAVATVLGPSDIPAAMADFQRARVLNPFSPELPLEEGFIWLSSSRPALALCAWQEALRRAGPRRSDFFREILESPLTADCREILASLAHRDPRLQLILVQQAPPEAFPETLNRLLAIDPTLESLSNEEQRALFRAWRTKRTASEFIAQMELHKPWLRAGWASAAWAYAITGDCRRAYELAQGHLQAPQKPSESHTAIPITELRHTFYRHPRDFATGYALFLAERREGEVKAALNTLQKLTRQKDCPAYFHYLEADLLAGEAQWQQAWEALCRSGLIEL